MTWFLRARMTTLAVTAMMGLPYQAIGQDFSQIRQKVKSSVVFIEALVAKRDGTDQEVISSTGFVVSKHGHVLTVAHAVPPAKPDGTAQYRASATTRHAPKFPVEVVYRQEELDLAILLLPAVRSWEPLEIGNSSETPEDARLYVLGFPRTSDLASAEGLLSSRFGIKGNWQTTLPIDYGNSGGPVFDIGGRVVGIAAGGFDEARAMTYVIPSNHSRPIRSIASVRIDTAVFATVKKNFDFVVSADHQQHREWQEQFCLEPQYKITKFSPTVTANFGDATKIVSLEPTAGAANCVSLTAVVAGNGVDKIGPIIINQKGQGGLAGVIQIGGELK